MQPGKLWQAVLGEIELSVSRGNFMTWFKQTQLLSCDNEAAVIGVPNVFIKQQLERKYRDLISATLQKNGLKPQRIDFKIHSAGTRKSSDDPMILDERPAAGNGPATAVATRPAPSPAATGGRGPQTGAHNSGGAPLTHSYRQGSTNATLSRTSSSGRATNWPMPPARPSPPLPAPNITRSFCTAASASAKRT